MSLHEGNRRRDALEALKHRKSTQSHPPISRSPSVELIRDSDILVPPSSSPAPTPQQSKYFASKIPQKIGGSDSLDKRTDAGKHEKYPSLNGSPSDVLRAIHRHSPQPLRRPKPRYVDPDEEESPVKPTPAAPSMISSVRQPSLVHAAQSVRDDHEEKMIQRLSSQFPNVEQSTISSLLRKYPGNPDRAINQIHYANQMKAEQESYTSAKNATSKRSSPLPVPASPVASNSKSKKKNENSTIYANRKRNRRSNDSEEEFSGGGSEDDFSDGEDGRKRRKGEDDEPDAEDAALKAFNEDSVETLTGTIACRPEQAAIIIKHRPYEDVEDVRAKLTKARGVSFKLFEQYTEIMEGFVQIDACLNRCEAIASDIAKALAVWKGASHVQNGSVVGTPRSDGLNDVKVDVAKVSELLKNETDVKKRKILKQYIQTQPSTLSEGTVLKDYQLLGVNWLNLLHSKRIGCILADEMGLGKTIQVIAFIAALKERGIIGPHLIFVPASTLENWTREFRRFAPDIDVQTYYGSQAERAGLRSDLKAQFRRGELEVVLASYTQMTSADDLSFFRKKIDFETCVYDEGHRLKSCTTKAYTDLLSIKPKWRLLLTGTPLQNNLQELVSLLMFIHKDTFTDAEPYLRAIFKSQGSASLLSHTRTTRARTMLTPFVLRRRKAQVLSLPPKVEIVEHCEMTKVQSKLYSETMQKSKKILSELTEEALEEVAGEDGSVVTVKKSEAGKKPVKGKKASGVTTSGSNILMDLRKAASHPLLFRRLYTDAKIRQIAKACLNTPSYCDCNLDYVIEDLQYMSDYEISNFCTSSVEEELHKYALDPEVFLEGGKVMAMVKHIERCKAEGKRMLLFSQFVMILDILEGALNHLGIRYTRLDGQTKTDERQSLVDEFNDDTDITVFLLSTKAGGVGINLTAASVVVIYDQDFNPHNDRQAADRAYRIGQERKVEVIKLITKNSIDEDMLEIGLTKLQLDDMVGGEEITLDGTDGAGADDKTAKETRKSLLTQLRTKFVESES
ncbi:hypothetical protein C343_07023 [Cryptococcus neoformans C23]|uniref:DNA helicase n=2 Tax=Cryptococcus neoformans TaxID=5207 RepID=A0A854QGQ9_CRYNE|nr:hypothetical protein CNAG_05609 [Cryptococcus neoformans var. grubii H99]AUB29267.1 hypothetical protein CKF44_05609 [Cryptococcus neoformans var. grubii]OWZ25981.1 hypothetical protein C347_06950 [Cryptococcus neoformans var. grubii AD2-60a]OWZ26111.1 hypothetical protein C353_07062 [Cryptococcus neoformans var. grubii AD1-83a]OWZ38010.1 hypothetical protein C343_07023 [Cryptococcus neoformans var. grubii C23]OWZ49753.1 hypothetical protein C368_07027 [Cryptococcus neoformans var. grubii 1|eukprot:XP_012053672.1 hypothetical protein CNAG_05609 [Cryptococcus neoformans var. grubii H99]